MAFSHSSNVESKGIGTEFVYTLKVFNMPENMLVKVQHFVNTEVQWNPFGLHSEKEAIVYATENLLLKLFERIVFKPSYGNDVAHLNIETADIVIGSESTLHGIPDLKIFELPCLFSENDCDDSEEENGKN